MANLITPLATLAWPAFWTPRLSKNPEPGEAAKYQGTFLFTPADEETEAFKAIVKEFNRILIEKLTVDKARIFLKDKPEKNIIKRDIETQGYPTEYSCYIKTQNKSKPVVLSTREGRDDKGKPTGLPEHISDPDDIYPGVRGRGNITPAWYDITGKTKGVTIYLNGFQKVADGDRLDGRATSSAVAGMFGFTQRAESMELTSAEDDNIADLLK
jgi:hypothetical protein